jgi:hypothetical protein
MRIPKPLVGIGIVTGSALATTFAFAAWNADGRGDATVAARTAQKLEVSNVAVPNALYPSATSNLSVKVKNLNNYPVTVTQIVNDTSGSGITVTAVGGVTCLPSNVSFTNQTGLSIAVAAGAEQTISVPGVKMIADAQDGCQGATFTFPVQAIGASSAS